MNGSVMIKKIGKIMKKIMLLGLLAVLVWLLCMVFGYISRELKRVPQTMAGDGWEQEQTETGISITLQEFADSCVWLESYLEDNAITEEWQWSRDETVWKMIDRISTKDGGELSDRDAFLYRKLVYAGELHEQERKLPDYYNYLSETEGVFNAIWMYIATGQEREERQEALAAWAFETAEALKWQQGAGRLYPMEQLETAITQCHQLLAGEFLTSDVKLKEAVENLLSCLKDLDAAEDITGLCRLPMGADYYDCLLERETGSGLGAKEMYDRLSELRDMLSGRLQDMEQQTAGSSLCETGTDRLLELLMDNTRRQFGDTGSRAYELRELPEVLKNRYYIGFYQKDITNGNHVIYIDQTYANQNAYEKYEMLAHEGYPGHMYSSTFLEDVPYDRLEQCLSSKGCSEGWAVYSEFLAAQWLEEEREGYTVFLTQKLLDEVILSQMDIGIHALGWGETQLEDYCRQVYGEIRPEGAAAIGRKLSGQPAMYQSYVVGYWKVCQLEETYVKKGHSREEFVEWFLRYGQAAFTVIEQYEDLY